MLPDSMFANKHEAFGHCISPQSDRKEPIYNWHSFKHSYSKKLVEKIIKEFEIGDRAWVLDPFCGGGTTLLACKENKINSMGFDILPFSVFLSNVKIRNYDPGDLKRRFKNFQENGKLKNNTNLPNIPIANKAFSETVRTKLLSIKQKIDGIRDEKVRDFYMLGLLSILESVSRTKKSGGFLRLVENNVSAGEVYPIFLNRIKQMIEDVEEFNNNNGKTKISVSVKFSDSRKLKTKRKFDAIITSPPYPNRHDYTRIYGLELIFNFVKSNDELKRIRYETLRSHVEARKKYSSNGYKQPKLLSELLSEIENNGTNNPQVIPMLKGYFEDMYISLKEMKRCLKINGKIALVVSNVRFAGVNIPVDELLAEVGEQAGLKTEAIWVARERGNSSQQMKKFKRKPSRESIVLWKC